jgi:hypothetical protein
VKEFRWANPHVMLHLVAKDASGQEVEWLLEWDSPSELTRDGVKRGSLPVGAAATATIRPLMSGKPGGQLMTVAINGQVYGRRR